MIRMGLSTTLRMPEPEIRHTTGAQPTRMIRFHVRTRESPADGPSAAFLKNSSVDKVRDSIVEFNSRFRQSLKRRSGKKIRTAQKGCEASKVESASDPRSPGLAACPARICSPVPRG